MPSPYGYRRGPSTYYEHAATGHHYDYNWKGMPSPGTRGAERRGLGCDNGGDYIDVSAVARFHKGLGDTPVSMSQYSKTRSILHSGPEQTHIFDEAPPSSLGFFGQLSENERRLFMLGGAALAGWFIYKRWGKK